MVMFWLLHHVESCVCLFRRFGGISEHIHDCLHQASVFVNIVGVAIHALRCYRAAVVAMPVPTLLQSCYGSDACPHIATKLLW